MEFIHHEAATIITGKGFNEFLALATLEKLSIYILGDWFWFKMEDPSIRYNVQGPLLIDDPIHLNALARDEAFHLHIDAYERFICKRNATDEDYLSGVTVTRNNVYLPKTALEGLQVPSTDDTTGRAKYERALTTYLREIWQQENQPSGAKFFSSLKKYVDQFNGPIINHWTTGKDGGGIRWNIGNTSGHMTKKSIQNKASVFKNEVNKNNVNN